ncbi:OCIA domain-containing protein 1 [Atheta coriaria]|uniref:OCIA domain-containing protein 1 n=1 Tax=Dalotia coriaria TaxID=877792 RepID=UPI0031F46433
MNPVINRDGDEQINFDPQRRNARDPYQFSPEEMRVMRECNKESFFQRCIPIGSLLGFGTYFGVKNGYIRGNIRYGAAPKVTMAVIIGYFLGKFSYQQKCAEKLMQLPNSQIGEMLRQRRKGNFTETLEPGIGPGMALAPFSNMGGSDTYSDVKPSSDLDTTRPNYEGLDDSHRPSVDNPIYEEEMPPLQKQATTYEELRRKNREEFAQKRTGGYKSSLSQTSTIMQPEREEPTIAQVRTNIYGDPIS